MLAVGAVASTGPPPAPQARRASHRLLARPQALPVAIQWPVVRGSSADSSERVLHDEVHDWRYAEDVAANYFGVDLLHGWTGEGAGIPLNSEVISTRSSTPHHAIHDGIASTARGAGGAHHGVVNAPRPRAYGPRASTDTRGDLPPRRDKPAAAKGLRRACPFKGMTLGMI